jgi:hypothetical protein
VSSGQGRHAPRYRTQDDTCQASAPSQHELQQADDLDTWLGFLGAAAPEAGPEDFDFSRPGSQGTGAGEREGGAGANRGDEGQEK